MRDLTTGQLTREEGMEIVESIRQAITRRGAVPVPFAVYDSHSTRGSRRCYKEIEAARTGGNMVEHGHTLLQQFLTTGPR